MADTKKAARDSRPAQEPAPQGAPKPAQWWSRDVHTAPVERTLTMLTEKAGELSSALLDGADRDVVRAALATVASLASSAVAAVDAGVALWTTEPPSAPSGDLDMLRRYEETERLAARIEPAGPVRTVTTHYPRCRDLAVDSLPCALGEGHDGTHTPFPVSDFRGHLAPHEVEALALDGVRLADAIDNACRVLVAAPAAIPQRFHMEVEAFAGDLLRTQLAAPMRAVAQHDRLYLRLGLVSPVPVRADAPAPAATSVTFHPKQSTVTAGFEERNPAMRAIADPGNALAAGLGVRPDTLERDLEAVDLNPPKGTIAMKPPREPADPPCGHGFVTLYRRSEADGTLSEWMPRCAACGEVIGVLVPTDRRGEYVVKIQVPDVGCGS